MSAGILLKLFNTLLKENKIMACAKLFITLTQHV